MKWKRVVDYSTAVLLLCILGTTPAKGEPNRWEEWRSLNPTIGLFPQIVGIQQVPVLDYNGYTDSSITNPSTSKGRVYFSTTDNLLHCLTSTGASCMPASGGSGTVTSVSFTGGLITVATPTTTPALTVAGTSGGIPYFSGASTWASSAAGTVNTLMKWGGAGNPPIASSVTDNGTTVAETLPTTNSAAGAASTPAMMYTGALFTGGGTTATFPFFYINQGTGPTTFSTSGTLFGLNAPTSFGGNFVDFHLNGGTSLFSVSSAGTVTGAGSFVAGANNQFSISGRTGFRSAADGRATLNNNANSANGFTRETFGTETDTNPAFCFSGLQISVCGGGGSATAGTFASPVIGAGGFTPVSIGTPTQVYNTAQTAQSASVGATTMLANPATDRNYNFNVNIGQLAQGTTCTLAGSVAVNVVYTDAITGNVYTIIVPLDASAGTSLIASLPLSTSAPTVANVGWASVPLRVKASTNIQYSTTYSQGTCSSGSPTYSVYPVLEAL